jgi:hypothetical protein
LKVARVRVTGPAAEVAAPAWVAAPSSAEPELQADRASRPTVRVARATWRERTVGVPVRMERDVMESSFGLIPGWVWERSPCVTTNCESALTGENAGVMGAPSRPVTIP